ncbi:MFS transporter [Actinophytocola algeriensis]|uniref:MFS family permease n=1 Tax=Actinophytocola algeriensis TaxID=1768010 RepID=A0A7W7QBS5_9PSEU|nr:MFS transporter [Actinophytocola algeriensis]MBB4910642.1 MFS family permease [Actinophytocola algeriensis]MBE1473635.1 MFS family permease [Actinophytocola algeriensis]
MAPEQRTAARTSVGRSTWILTVCQAFYFAGVSIDLTLTGIVGLELAPTPAMATVPLATISIVGALCSVGTGLAAARIGYVAVMITGACTAIVGALLSMAAVSTNSFWLLCLGTGLVGAYRSTGGYIRYMAADRASAGGRERALAFVLYGGLVSAFAGPFVATWSTDLLGDRYVGPYLMVGLFALTNIPLMLLLRAGRVRPEEKTERQPPIPLSEVRRTPEFIVGLLSLLAAGALMTIVMAVGPLGGHHAGHTEHSIAATIQWHLVGMFAPAIFSGRVLARLGPGRTGAIGAGLIAAGAVSGVLGTEFVNFLLALALNGVGWNFLYLAGTTLIVRCYPPGRGGRVQAVAEGVGAATGVLAALSASVVFVVFGWHAINWTVLAIAAALAVTLLTVIRPTESTTPEPAKEGHG